MIDHVMLDLETLDSGPRSAIIAIGAVCFRGPHVGLEQYYEIDQLSCWNLGLTRSEDTAEWWDRQSPEARTVLTPKRPWSIRDALSHFSIWMLALNDPRVWGNGAAFDNVILRSTYETAGLPTPWKFWNDRCFRTVKAAIGKPIERIGVHHNALDDAKSQANYLLNNWVLE